MCDLVSEFILCTCQEKSGNEKNEKTYTDYKWTLQVKVHYPKQNPTYGKAKCQSKNLGEGLTEKFVLKLRFLVFIQTDFKDSILRNY
jgi:hypothetical protein